MKGIVPYELTVIIERTCRGRCPHLPAQLYENDCRFVGCADSAHRVFFCFFYGRFVNRPYDDTVGFFVILRDDVVLCPLQSNRITGFFKLIISEVSDIIFIYNTTLR